MERESTWIRIQSSELARLRAGVCEHVCWGGLPGPGRAGVAGVRRRPQAPGRERTGDVLLLATRAVWARKEHPYTPSALLLSPINDERAAARQTLTTNVFVSAIT